MPPSDWDALNRELERWASDERVVSLWWRDDDAVDWTAPLEQLLDLADAFEVTVGLAVVPLGSSDRLAVNLEGRRSVAVLQHGYAHRNHAASGSPAIECGGDRPASVVWDELREGRRLLEKIVGSRLEPILAAPWNRIDPAVLTALPELGYLGVSAFGPRVRWPVPPGLAMVNAHVDPLNWREGGRFAGEEKALRNLVGELQTRRNGSEAGEPLGLLTHHLCHDAPTWAFLHRLLGVTRAHPAARWLDVGEVFAAAARSPAGSCADEPG